MENVVAEAFLDQYAIESGVVLIDKPDGMTSFGVIRELRKVSGIKKIGHAGTLDPLATGLLVIGYGKGTKKLSAILQSDKTYVAKIFFGFSTTTQDAEGEIVEQVDKVEIDKKVINEAVKNIEGTHIFPVSVYSAIKKDGEPYYKKARRAAKIGSVIEDVPLREMTVYAATIQNSSTCRYRNIKGVEIECLFTVKSGTYIRSLAVALGQQCGVPAHMSGLRRVYIGKFSLEQAHSLESIKKDRETRS